MTSATEGLHIDKTYTTLRLIGGNDCAGTSIGDLRVAGGAHINKSVCIGGNLTVEGTTVFANAVVSVTEDINICLGNVQPGPPSDSTANTGGVILLAAAGESKSMIWYDDTDAWHFNQDLNLGAGRIVSGACGSDSSISGSAYRIDGDVVLSGNTLGAGVTSSSLEAVGTLRSGQIDVSRPIISAISVGTPPTLTTSEPHGLTTGDHILLSGTDSTPPIDGCYMATVTGASSFTVPASTSGAGTTGTLSEDKFPIDIGLSDLTSGDHTLRCGANLVSETSESAVTFRLIGESGQTDIYNTTNQSHSLGADSALASNYSGVQRSARFTSSTSNTDISGRSRAVDAVNTYRGTNTTYGDSESTILSTGGRFETSSLLQGPRARLNSTAVDGVSTSVNNDGLNRGVIGEGGGSNTLEQATGVTGLANDAGLSIGVLGAVNKTRAQLAANTHSWAMGGGFSAALMGCNFDTGPDQYGLFVRGNSNLVGNVAVSGIITGDIESGGTSSFGGTVDFTGATVIGLTGGGNVSAVNLGGGANVYVTGTSLSYRSLVGGNSVVVVESGNVVSFDLSDSISADVSGNLVGDVVSENTSNFSGTVDFTGATVLGLAAGDVSNGNNLVSAGSSNVFSTKIGTVLQFRGLVGGNNISTTQSASAVTFHLDDTISANVIGDIVGDLSGNLVGMVAGDVTGNVNGTLTGELFGDVTGNVNGDLVGNLFGNVTGDIVGNVSGELVGNVIGDIVGNVSGNIIGDLIGNIVGDISGNVAGDVSGDVTGNISGTVTGNVNGDVNGNLTGTLFGNVIGNVNGDIVGNLVGTVFGDVSGNVSGRLVGDVMGNVSGNVTGTLFGSVFGNIFSPNQIKYIDGSYIEQFTLSNTYTKITEFIFNGTDKLGNVAGIYAISRKDPSVASYNVRIVDFTNATQIAERTGLTNESYSVIDLGALGNIPADESVWEIQTKQLTVTPGRVYSSGYSIQYNQLA